MQNLTSKRQLVPVPQIPKELTTDVNQHIRRHSVSMVVADEDETLGRPCGGVLCLIEGMAGVLTARHVWDDLRRAQKLILMLGPRHPYRIDRTLLHALVPDSSATPKFDDARTPDIAFIPLSSKHKASIEARQKVFYSIDRRRGDFAFDVYGDSGFWIAVGNPVEMMRREDRAVRSLSYITDVEKSVEYGQWDYLFVNLNLESNVPIPSNLQGMSGGGLWRARFNINADSKQFTIENPTQDILLQGIIFLQTALDGRQLIAHGPKSIYESLPLFLQASK